MKKPLIIIAGPTAVGKTDLSIALAKKMDGSILSADSMQVYRHMNIGSAKIAKEEMQGIPHYLIDEFEPSKDFNVLKFQQLAKAYIDEIYKNHRIPIVVGGTGFYIQALLYDIDFTKEEGDSSYRTYLEELSRSKGPFVLHGMLKQVDPAAAEQIHENNTKRVIRALEFYHLTGKKISEHNETERKKEALYDVSYFVLNDERKRLYERIDKRVDLMIEQGLVEEVQRLKAMGCHKGMVSMQGLGYKEILNYLDGQISLDEAIYLIKRDTRHFAKRQLTWFHRERDVVWVNKPDFQYSNDKILAFIIEHFR
ncbi:tRNA (adenosine(37)-N6)-dimethylallyltransferase MiaA [Lachnospiraceae bacterium ZAX-1]